MIRRQPTLIALTENDVSDVRDFLDRIRASKEEQQRRAQPPPPSTSGVSGMNSTSSGASSSTSTTMTGLGLGPGPSSAAGSMITAAAETAGARSKEERLGLR